MDFVSPLYIKTGSISDHSLELNHIISDNQLFLLCDEHTKEFMKYLSTEIDSLSKANVFIIPAGEENKNIDTAKQLWKFLSENNARRNAVLINLGGGLISDLGGFVASTYKRGISFINIPTSLLGMIDAAIGGKTGINLENKKNQIGVFNLPLLVICDPFFLNSLPDEQFRSGFAEIIKHGLIYNKKYWEYCSNNSFTDLDLVKVISGSINIKSEIVSKDPEETGIRKLLNFGHTIGHAIETFMLNKNEPVLHGDAIATGMLIEAYISYLINELNSEEFSEIETYIKAVFPKILYSKDQIPLLIELMKNDKKNNSDQINFTLLDNIGNGKYNNQVDQGIIEKALENYHINK